jgi:hypothetical protein
LAAVAISWLVTGVELSAPGDPKAICVSNVVIAASRGHQPLSQTQQLLTSGIFTGEMTREI